jgi:hypothetical protein
VNHSGVIGTALRGRFVLGALTLTVLLSAVPAARAESEALRVTRVYERARSLHRESPGNPVLAWEFSRACFDRCETIPSKPVRIGMAQEAVDACRKALVQSPTEAGCHYYLGLNLGILAQAQPLKALGRVREMEAAWQACLLLDPGFDHAGADRSLGMLYDECPPPPLGVGSSGKARFHLERAAKMAPDYPGNRLQWIEFLVGRDRFDEARIEFESLQRALPEARQRFSGDRWTTAWKDWDSRIESLGKRWRTVPSKESRPTPAR